MLTSGLVVVDHRRDGLVATGRAGGVVDRGGHLLRVDRLPGLACLLLQPAAARHDAGVDGILVDLAGELVDEVLDRRLVVADARLEIHVHVAPARVARDAIEDVALAAAIDRLLDHAVDVGGLVEALGAERVVLAVVADDHRLLERGDDLALDDLARGVRVTATHVDAADLDPRGDLVLLGVVVCPDAHSEQQAHGEQRHQGDQDLLMHLQVCAHLGVSDQLFPCLLNSTFHLPRVLVRARFATLFAGTRPRASAPF